MGVRASLLCVCVVFVGAHVCACVFAGTVPSPVLAVSTSPTEASVFAREGSGDVPVLTLPIALHGAAPVTLMAPPPGFNTGTHSLTQALGPPSTASTPAPGAHFPPPLLRSFSSSRSLLNPMPPLHVPPHVSVSPPASFRSPPTPSSIVAPSPRISRRLRIVKVCVSGGVVWVRVRSGTQATLTRDRFSLSHLRTVDPGFLCSVCICVRLWLFVSVFLCAPCRTTAAASWYKG